MRDYEKVINNQKSKGKVNKKQNFTHKEGKY